jgi:hypothetical protein
MRPAAMRAASFYSAIRALLRQFDALINTETRGTSAVRKLVTSFEPLSSDRLRRDDQEDPICEPIGIELSLRAALEENGAQVVHFGDARSQEVILDGVREHSAALVSSGFTTTSQRGRLPRARERSERNRCAPADPLPSRLLAARD